MKNILYKKHIFSFLFLIVMLFFCTIKLLEQKNQVVLNIHNWGNHISDGSNGYLDINKEFEKRTGIKINYTTYQDNESMFAKLTGSDTKYDVIFPSDYMIGKLIEKKMVQKLNFNLIPNSATIDKEFLNQKYDPKNEYSVPYTWGLVGIFYNKELVDEKEDEIDWDIFWKEKYKNKILMFEGSPRDTFVAPLIKLGFSINTKNKEELNKAFLEIKKQKYLIKGYVNDQIFDKISSKEAALGPYYSDSNILTSKNENIGFAIPKSGTNKFINGMCVPANSSHPYEAMIYINFLCDPEIATENISYIGYSTPQSIVKEKLPLVISSNKQFYPNESILLKSEVYETMPDEINNLINDLWLKSRIGSNDSKWPIILVFLGLVFLYFLILIYKKRKRENL